MFALQAPAKQPTECMIAKSQPAEELPVVCPEASSTTTCTLTCAGKTTFMFTA